MSKSSVKPKATVIWSEQIEKLKQKFSSLTDSEQYFARGDMDEMFSASKRKVGSPDMSYIK
jgi:ABC-type uncharacterized transport system substrate-binding protein